MPNLIATHLKSQSLFTPATDADGVAEQIQSTKELLKEACCGNKDAISSLISFAAGAENAPGLRAEVGKNLLKLYSDPDTKAHVRKEIAAQAHSFYELSEINNQKAGSTLKLKLPSRLQYLAGRHEASRFGLSWVLDKIASVFQVALRQSGEVPDKNILSGTRYVTFMELFHSHSPQGAFKGQPAGILDLNWGDAAVAKNVKEVAAELLSNRADAPKAKFTYLRVGGAHWIPVVFRREGNKVAGYVLDSAWLSGAMRHSSVTKIMQEALGKDSAGFHYKYAEMQGLTNACGLMTSRFMSWMDGQLDANPAMDIPAAIDSYVADWKAYSSEQQDAIVTGLRAEKLAILVDKDSQGLLPAMA